MLTRKLINKLILRKPKAGILNVASFAGVIPCIYYNVYSATKAYVNVLSEHLKLEFPQLDILIANPLEVSTNMIYNRNPDMYI
jgi:short-subunit dehydrogenase